MQTNMANLNMMNFEYYSESEYQEIWNRYDKMY
jgi:hypothetical protein